MKIHTYPKLLLVLSLLSTPRLAVAQTEEATATPSIKTFALNADQLGAAANSVNLFSGDVALPLNLISLPGHNGLDVSVTISYSSAVQNIAGRDNIVAPTGILGLGWSMAFPKIVTDHKQTVSRDDDEYYLVEGGSSNQLIRTTSGFDGTGSYYTYETKNYQFWKVKYYYTNSFYNSGGKWEIIKEDGTRYIYGDHNSGRNTIQWIVGWESNWIGNSAELTGQVQIANSWSLSEIVNTWGERITFEYLNVDRETGSSAGKKHTEASYLHKITDALGRTIVFTYQDKVIDKQNFYEESHIEQTEPDAYQEFYETKFLNNIDVFDEKQASLFSVFFTYSSLDYGTDSQKMLLAKIEQKNKLGQALPGMQFKYHQDAESKINGYLEEVTYPTGGKVFYQYNSNGVSLKQSNRQLKVSVPAGYAEPLMRISDDYVVALYRQLGTGTVATRHKTELKDMKLYVYTWTGKWHSKYIRTIGNVAAEVELSGGSTQLLNYFNYNPQNIQVAVEKDFFAVLVKGSGTNYFLYIESKDPLRRGEWQEYTRLYDYGAGIPTLITGSNYIMVGSQRDDSVNGVYYSSRLFTFQGGTWNATELNQTNGEHFYTGTNNYFISHNRDRVEFNFHYLSEDRKWNVKNNRLPTFSTNDPSYWYASNSFALAMAGDNAEHLYNWDYSYTNFRKDVSLGAFADHSKVFLIDNSTACINEPTTWNLNVARFTGASWVIAGRSSSSYYMASYGQDHFLRTDNNYNFLLKTFNPNSLSWIDGVSSPRDIGQYLGSQAGSNNFFIQQKLYARLTEGSWIPVLTVPGSTYIGPFRFGKDFFLYSDQIQFLRNNIPYGVPLTINAAYHVAYGKGNESKYFDLLGTSIVVGSAKVTSGGTFADTYEFVLNYITDAQDGFGEQKDYPVTSLTIDDGKQPQYTSFDYNLETATTDLTGTTAQYNEVTVIPGSQVASSKPNGYTKTFFYNGLTNSDVAGLPLKASLIWTGFPYKTQVFNATSSTPVSENITELTDYYKTLSNDQGVQVNVAYYARPSSSTSQADGMKTIAFQYYDQNTGLVTSADSRLDNITSGVSNTIRIEYKYFWQQYDPNREKNILTPVIQTKKTILRSGIPNKVVEAGASTWKQWNGVFAPHKTYRWLRTGSTDFDFTNWSETGEPTTGWQKVSQIDQLDAKGNVLQTTSY